MDSLVEYLALSPRQGTVKELRDSLIIHEQNVLHRLLCCHVHYHHCRQCLLYSWNEAVSTVQQLCADMCAGYRYVTRPQSKQCGDTVGVKRIKLNKHEQTYRICYHIQFTIRISPPLNVFMYKYTLLHDN